MPVPRTCILLALATAPLGAQDAGSTPAAVDAVDDARFAELRRLLTPGAAASWRSVPWRIDLLEAQREAAARRQPLFVWAMDGHPLGCT